MKNSKLRKFVKRFDKTENRESIDDLSREFKEELFSTGILDKKSFGDLNYKYCGRHMTKVEYSNIFNIYELLLADIIEVKLSDLQEKYFCDLMNSNDNSKYIFANVDDINSLGVEQGSETMVDTIANHSHKILAENSDKLMLKNKYADTFTISNI